jgi:dolichol-phosphate mannosyltransferase
MTESGSFPAEWAVPEFDATVFAPRVSQYALVIPVINEGERIRRQLRAITELGLQLDTIIADGGSKDGSLDLDFLRSVGVAALLVKRGPGRLSAQLRVGYAWVLARGYRGVITIDGNGKDGVDALPRFVAALDAGYDIIQGSRYQPGGEAINTPADRWLAGKFVHAPLINHAARFRYTDTTNGFRAYSERALRDPRVAPFRDVFLKYNLLFYLLVRIPQLGYRACELPVSRRYPVNAMTPTKIAGTWGRLDMLVELFSAVSGRLRPP